MYKLILFVLLLLEKVKKEDLLSTANDLTYKILLSLFPLIIFFMTILGFLDLDVAHLTSELSGIVPAEILSIFQLFVDEVINTRRPSLLSTSLIFAVASSTSGFKSLINGINKAYGRKDDRSFIKIYGISFISVIAFISCIILSLILLIFGNTIMDTLEFFFYIPRFMPLLISIVSDIVTILLVLITTILINKLAISRPVSIRNLLPGSLFTVIIWVIASTGFNIYLRTFAQISTIYGSVAGIMILMIWVNILCIVLLLGSAINAMLEKKRF